MGPETIRIHSVDAFISVPDSVTGLPKQRVTFFFVVSDIAFDIEPYHTPS